MTHSFCIFTSTGWGNSYSVKKQIYISDMQEMFIFDKIDMFIFDKINIAWGEKDISLQF